MLGLSALGQDALGRHTDVAGTRWALAAQAVPAPLSSAEAVVTDNRLLSAAQTIPVPLSSALIDVDVASSGAVLVAVPTQVATVFNRGKFRNPVIAQREGYAFIAHREAHGFRAVRIAA